MKSAMKSISDVSLLAIDSMGVCPRKSDEDTQMMIMIL